MTFKQLRLNRKLVKALAAKGYESPTPIQEQAIPHILKQSDMIGSAQTGTGKTAAFALPTIHLLKRHKKKHRSLVLTPTRELAVQVYEQFEAYSNLTGIKLAIIYGGVGYQQQLDQLRAPADVVIATPGRLLDHEEKGNIHLNEVEILILDEVDRMLDLGFIDDVRRIEKLCSHKKRQTLLFSATIPESVRKLSSWALEDPVEVIIGERKSPAATVDHSVYPVDPLQKFDLMVALIEGMEIESLIVFTRTRIGADRITRWLKEHDYQVSVMHSDLKQTDRLQALRDFKEGETNILVATDIASRGLDIKGVTHVINYDVPQHAEDYVHRIGRTGRANTQGVAITLASPEENPELMRIEKYIDGELDRRKLEEFPYRYDPLPAKPKPKRKKRNRGFQ
ncbi:MAG: DEAD/DEAH box helicase [Opitutales bacterium]|nr:DEAD/DEAH box helicase [Opitutales bacterium]NRA28022.1 DEAD/DEAH box helicase [Opitutales bacterium]